MRQLICDRCGRKIIGNYEPTIEIREHGPMDSPKTFDICNDCCDSFFFWIDEVRNGIKKED